MSGKWAVNGLPKERRAWYDKITERVMKVYGIYGYAQPTYYDMLRQQMAPQPAQQQANVLPAQQVIQVAGRQSIDTLQMSPNSSVLIMDTSAPIIVWLCVSDGLGKVTATAYDITVHQDTPPFDIAGFAESVEGRLKELENKVLKEAEKHEPDVASTRSEKPNGWNAGKH